MIFAVRVPFNVYSTNIASALRFDVESFGFDTAEDEKGMLETVTSLNQLITKEIEESGIHPSRIVLGGFSQGGAMSLLTGLTTEKKLAGVVVLSGWLPLSSKFKKVYHAIF
jgi:lysophospholipase I